MDMCSKISSTVLTKVSNLTLEEISIASRLSVAMIFIDRPLGILTLSGRRQSLMAFAFLSLSNEISIREVI
jgi:hypothetical protein